MKGNDIKKVFEQIKADESMKSRILENVYEESKKSKVINFKYKKSLSVLAASLVLVCGTLLYNNKEISIPSPPSASGPLVSANEPLDKMESRNGSQFDNKEFNSFNLQNLKDNTVKVEIRNHENTNTFKEVSDKEFINDILAFIQNAKEKDIKYGDYANEEEREKAYKVLEEIGNSQAKGNSIAMSFITKDDTTSSIRVNLDLNTICINEKYYEVSSDMIKRIDKELKTIKDFNEINKPGQN